MGATAEKLWTFAVLVGFAMFAILNAGNVGQLLSAGASTTTGIIGGVARA